jgi:hypothetical protein
MRSGAFQIRRAKVAGGRHQIAKRGLRTSSAGMSAFRHDSVFRRSPRIFMAIRQTWSTIKAYALVCQPHTIQSALLTRNSQNPALRRAGVRDATHHAAPTVTNIAGHCSQSSRVTRDSPATGWRFLSHYCRYHLTPILRGCARAEHSCIKGVGGFGDSYIHVSAFLLALRTSRPFVRLRVWRSRRAGGHPNVLVDVASRRRTCIHPSGMRAPTLRPNNCANSTGATARLKK